jgi:hypothetical protein
LTAIGGSATQAFVDDGTGGDAVAGDNIFSYTATVPNGSEDPQLQHHRRTSSLVHCDGCCDRCPLPTKRSSVPSGHVGREWCKP